jgi:hypothetical protein
MPVPETAADMSAVLLAQQPSGDAFERVDQRRECDLGRVVNQQVDVVVLAVELDQFGTEAVAHLDHDFFTAAQEFVGEHSTPVFGCEDQMSMQGVDDGSPPADIGVRFSSR